MKITRRDFEVRNGLVQAISHEVEFAESDLRVRIIRVKRDGFLEGCLSLRKFRLARIDSGMNQGFSQELQQDVIVFKPSDAFARHMDCFRNISFKKIFLPCGHIGGIAFGRDFTSAIEIFFREIQAILIGEKESSFIEQMGGTRNIAESEVSHSDAEGV